MPVLRMVDLELGGKRVLIREDLNVPLQDGVVTSDARIRAALPTIEAAVSAGSGVMLVSHLGRPKEGASETENAEFTLAPVAQRLSELLGRNVTLVKDWLDNPPVVADGDVVLLENVRFFPGEKADDENLAKRMASLCDVFVMDAFGTAHRAQASTHGVARFAPVACGGPLLLAELDALARSLNNPIRPLVAIVGGSKVSTKLEVLAELSGKVDCLIPGGGIANTFIAAAGYSVGKSLYEPEMLNIAEELLAETTIPLPIDVVVAAEVSADAKASRRMIAEIGDEERILDIGPQSAAALSEVLAGAGTIVWNGPLGVFEIDQFAAGTRAIAETVASGQAFSIAGGGDTLAALDKFGLRDRISYVSTGGGAFLEYVEGKTLPAVAALETRFEG